MKKDNRETLQRAVGVICGAAYVSTGAIANALMDAVEMIDCVLAKEESEGKNDVED